MLSAKQGNHWYDFLNVFRMTRPLSGTEHWTSRTRSEHSTTRLSRLCYCWKYQYAGNQTTGCYGFHFKLYTPAYGHHQYI